MKSFRPSQVYISQVQIVGESGISAPSDILLEGNKVVKIAGAIEDIQNAYQIDGRGKYLSLGWLDLRAVAGEPGFEHKETLLSLDRAAVAGGFAGVCLHANTQHPFQSRETIGYLRNFQSAADFYPAANASHDGNGNEMTEYIDLYDAGTLTFSDGEKVLSNTSLLMRALRYLPHTGARLMMIAAEKDLIKGGLMHEGITSTFLGMRGIPALAEELAVQKAISVLRFTGGKLHFSLVSSAKTAEMIADAKREGLDVTADTAFYHLDLTDEALIDFDTNLKVFPPLRAEEDRSALVEAVKTGVIDAVVSNHSAQDTESKRLEFDMAENGMLGLQTAFPVALRHTGMSAWVRSVTTGARKVLGLPQTEIEEGNTVSFTLFDTATEQVFDRQTNYSKSKNSPYLGNVMRGKVFAVMSEKGILSVDM